MSQSADPPRSLKGVQACLERNPQALRVLWMLAARPRLTHSLCKELLPGLLAACSRETAGIQPSFSLCPRSFSPSLSLSRRGISTGRRSVLPQSCSLWGAPLGVWFLTLDLLCRDPGPLATLFVEHVYKPLSCLSAPFGLGIWRVGGPPSLLPPFPPTVPPPPGQIKDTHFKALSCAAWAPANPPNPANTWRGVPDLGEQLCCEIEGCGVETHRLLALAPNLVSCSEGDPAADRKLWIA